MRSFLMLLVMTQLASAPSARGQEVRVRIELLEVHCILDTESVLDSDLFYVVTALHASVDRSDVIGPVALKIGETKSFPEDRRVIFDAKLPIRGAIRGGMRAFNQNSPAAWPNRAELAEKATNAVAGAAATFRGAVDERAGAILNSVADIYSGLPGSQSVDSPLGRIELNISGDGDAQEIGEWKMLDNTVGANTFNYTVRYRITRTKAPEALRR